MSDSLIFTIQAEGVSEFNKDLQTAKKNTDDLTKSLTTTDNQLLDLSKGLAIAKENLKKVDGKEFKRLESEIKATESAIRGLGGESKSLRSRFAENKQAISTLVETLETMRIEGNAGTEVFKILEKQLQDLKKEGGSLKDSIGDMNAELSYLGSDTANIDGLIGVTRGVASAFGLAQGAQQLFGDENEDLQKSLVKLNAVMVVMTSLQEIQNALQKESAASMFVMSKAQALYTFVVGGSTGAMKLFRIALASTGIGLVVIALGTLIANFDRIKASIEGNSKEFQAYKNTIAKFVPIIGLIIKAFEYLQNKFGSFGAFLSGAKEALTELFVSIGDVIANFSLKPLENLGERMNTALNKGVASFKEKELAEALRGKNAEIVKELDREINIIEAKGKESNKKKIEKALLEANILKSELKYFEGSAKDRLEKENDYKDKLNEIEVLRIEGEKKNSEDSIKNKQRELDERIAIQKIIIASDESTLIAKKNANIEISKLESEKDLLEIKGTNARKLRILESKTEIAKIQKDFLDNQLKEGNSNNLKQLEQNSELDKAILNNKLDYLKLYETEYLVVKLELLESEYFAEVTKAKLSLYNDKNALDNKLELLKIEYDAKVKIAKNEKAIADETKAIDTIIYNNKIDYLNREIKAIGKGEDIKYKNRVKDLEDEKFLISEKIRLNEAMFKEKKQTEEEYKAKKDKLNLEQKENELAQTQENQTEFKRVQNERFQIASDVAGQIFSTTSAYFDYEQAMLQSKLDNREISEKEFAKRSAKLKEKQAIADKAQALFSIAITTAQNVVKAGANIPLAVAMGILGAIQAGLVLAKPIPKFKDGGFVKNHGMIKGKSHENGGVLVEAEGNEYFMPTSPALKYQNHLEAMRKGTYETFIKNYQSTKTNFNNREFKKIDDVYGKRQNQISRESNVILSNIERKLTVNNINN